MRNGQHGTASPHAATATPHATPRAHGALLSAAPRRSPGNITRGTFARCATRQTLFSTALCSRRVQAIKPRRVR